MLLLHGDCLELLKELPDESIDLIFCDLPYATAKYSAVSCKWNTPIDLEKLWIEFMRVKKLRTPLFFTTTTKFGVELINSAPKKCFFRYDLVWVKSQSCGFLSARRMPMRKHEMVYVFYEKLPLYDLSSHQHKFIKKDEVKKEDKEATMINGTLGGAYDARWQKGHQGNSYDPLLPTSVVKEETYQGIYSELPKTGKGKDAHSAQYDPPLPTSVLKEEWNGELGEPMTDKTIYGSGLKENGYYQMRKNGEGTAYDPPLPTSIVRENKSMYGKGKNTRGVKYTEDYRDKHGKKEYDPPLPTSVVKEPEPEPEPELQVVKKKEYGPCKNYGVERVFYYDENGNKLDGKDGTNTKYDPPLPTTMLEIKSTRGKHSTEKPVALMEWILKYYSKEGDFVLDPTMGSGSTGVACQRMNRDFVGFEMDAEIFDSAWQRLEE